MRILLTLQARNKSSTHNLSLCFEATQRAADVEPRDAEVLLVKEFVGNYTPTQKQLHRHAFTKVFELQTTQLLRGVSNQTPSTLTGAGGTRRSRDPPRQASGRGPSRGRMAPLGVLKKHSNGVEGVGRNPSACDKVPETVVDLRRKAGHVGCEVSAKESAV